MLNNSNYKAIGFIHVQKKITKDKFDIQQQIIGFECFDLKDKCKCNE